jgi:hypothetical protein
VLPNTAFRRISVISAKFGKTKRGGGGGTASGGEGKKT